MGGGPRLVLTETVRSVSVDQYRQSDEAFLLSCQGLEEFEVTIGRLPSDRSNCWIIKYGSEAIGCAAITPMNLFCIDYVEVSTFVHASHRLLSAYALRAVLNQALGLASGSARLLFLVYGDNRRCITLLDRLGIECVAEIPRAALHGGKYVSVRYYLYASGGGQRFDDVIAARIDSAQNEEKGT